MEMQRINMDVPRDLWRRVKVRAAEEGRLMREIVAEALEKYLEGAKVMTAHQDTYTIVCHRESGALLACVPDSEDWREAVRRDMEAIGEDMPADHEIEVHTGCVLSDEYEDYDQVVFVSGLSVGTLESIEGRPYRYAIRP